MHPQVQAFFDPQTSTVSYVLFEAAGGACAIIDPVLDFDPKAGRTNTVQADRIVDFVRENGLSVEWILETHVHADHLSAAPFLKSRLGGRVGIGARITDVQRHFKRVFNAEEGFATDGCQFDHLFADDEVFAVGGLKAPGNPHAGTYARLHELSDRGCIVRGRYPVHARRWHGAGRFSRR